MPFLKLLYLLFFVFSCDDPAEIKDDKKEEEEKMEDDVFYFGSDLSYVNQILDYNGEYKVDGVVENPYKIFSDRGNDIVRLRIWHNPTWTKEIYDGAGTQLYNDLYDVERAIKESKDQGMQVMLDFHYSDTWTDPGHHEAPEAWKEIESITVLGDSIYNYTYKTLSYLNDKGLMPEFVQVGNETNCGMFWSERPDGFPPCGVCEGNGSWVYLNRVFDSGIQAVRDVANSSGIDTKIILHVADPANISWWFTSLLQAGDLSFDIIGISFYPIWHDEISVSQIEQTVAEFKSTFEKDIMVVEAAYPWSAQGNDSYGNIFGGGSAVAGYPFTPEGQLEMMKDITQGLISGGAIGIVYWEPAWITSDLRDRWGSGSSWENVTFFDFDGNANKGFDYMTYDYK